MRRTLIGLILLFVFFPLSAMAMVRTIEVEFSFDAAAVSDKVVAGYRLYADGLLQCDVPVTSQQTFNCAMSIQKQNYVYTLTAVYTDATESPQSPPFPFSYAGYEKHAGHEKRPGLLRINGAMFRIIVNQQ